MTPFLDAALRDHRAHLADVHDRIRERPCDAARISLERLREDIATMETLDDEDRLLADAYLGLMA